MKLATILVLSSFFLSMNSLAMWKKEKLPPATVLFKALKKFDPDKIVSAAGKADLNARNKAGQTPSEFAKALKYPQALVNALVNKEAWGSADPAALVFKLWEMDGQRFDARLNASQIGFRGSSTLKQKPENIIEEKTQKYETKLEKSEILLPEKNPTSSFSDGILERKISRAKTIQHKRVQTSIPKKTVGKHKKSKDKF